MKLLLKFFSRRTKLLAEIERLMYKVEDLKDDSKQLWGHMVMWRGQCEREKSEKESLREELDKQVERHAKELIDRDKVLNRYQQLTGIKIEDALKGEQDCESI